jgi:hypothetical protein
MYLERSGRKGTLHHSSSSGASTTGHLVASIPLHPKKQEKKKWRDYLPLEDVTKKR